MDAYAWLLFVAGTASAGLVIVGLIGIIRQQADDFELVLAANAELDELLNAELSANRQLMLEREMLEVVNPMPHWLDTLPVRPVIELEGR